MHDEQEELRTMMAAVRAWVEQLEGRGWTTAPEERPEALVSSSTDTESALSSAPSTVRQEQKRRLAASASKAELPAQSNAAPSGAWGQIATDARTDDVKSLAQVRAELGTCTRCALSRSRRQIVFGVGAADADVVVIGEAPGAEEDRKGEPFVGPAGQMLDRMLEHVLGLTREQVYILNVVKCRPPNNRNPNEQEIISCRPYLDAQLAAIQPKLILVLGTVAFKTLFPGLGGIKKNRGNWMVLEDVPVMSTFHPAYLLRRPEDKRLTFADLKAVRARIDAL